MKDGASKDDTIKDEAMSDEEFDEMPADLASDSDEISEQEADYAEDGNEDYEDEEIPVLSDDGDNNSEDAYEADEPVQTRPSRGGRPAREVKKRKLTFYDEDDLLDSEEEAPKKKISVKIKMPRRAAASKPKVEEDDDFDEMEGGYRPDISRMTERQRARLEEERSEKYEDSMFARMDEQLLALNRKTQKKKETAEQMAVRKAENARKRAHYKTKQLEEEKRDTLNKLLKRRANKTREKVDDEAAESKQTLKPRRPVISHPAMIRWVNRAEGSLIGLPE